MILPLTPVQKNDNSFSIFKTRGRNSGRRDAALHRRPDLRDEGQAQVAPPEPSHRSLMSELFLQQSILQLQR
jgi:hypothetical protein